jgi:hypothetical protein
VLSMGKSETCSSCMVEWNRTDLPSAAGPETLCLWDEWAVWAATPFRSPASWPHTHVFASPLIKLWGHWLKLKGVHSLCWPPHYGKLAGRGNFQVSAPWRHRCHKLHICSDDPSIHSPQASVMSLPVLFS